MAIKKMQKVLSVTDKSGAKGPYAVVKNQDAEGKYPAKEMHLFGPVAKVVLAGGEGLYEVEISKNAKGYWQWDSANKVGSNGGSGVNGSGVGTVAKATDAKTDVAIAALQVAFNVVKHSYAPDAKMQADLAAKEVLGVTKLLYKGMAEILSPKPVKPPPPPPQPEPSMDPEAPEIEWPGEPVPF